VSQAADILLPLTVDGDLGTIVIEHHPLRGVVHGVHLCDQLSTATFNLLVDMRARVSGPNVQRTWPSYMVTAVFAGK